MTYKNLKIQGETLGIVVSSLLFMITRHAGSGGTSCQGAIAEHFSVLAKYPGLEGTVLRDTCLWLQKTLAVSTQFSELENTARGA